MSGQPFKLVDLPTVTPTATPSRGWFGGAEEIANSAIVLGMGASFIQEVFWPKKSLSAQCAEAALGPAEIRAQLFWLGLIGVASAPFGLLGAWGIYRGIVTEDVWLLAGLAAAWLVWVVGTLVAVDFLTAPVKKDAEAARAKTVKDTTTKAALEAQLAAITVKLKHLK